MAQRDIQCREIDLTVRYGSREVFLTANGERGKCFRWNGSELYLRHPGVEASRLVFVVVITNSDEDVVKTVYRSND